jgi:uncharacterized repeat protein (TIGR01451 family)
VSTWRHAVARALPLLLWLTVLCLPAALAQQAFSSRYVNKAVAGDIALIGNVNYHCTTAVPPATNAQAASCTTAQGGGTITNNNTYMVALDTDSSAATTNSSSATLNISGGSTVLFAGLYWSGISSSATNRSSVTLTGPSGVSSVVSASAANTAVIGSVYQSFVDVTSSVTASGVYTVGNIASTVGSNNWAGWTLVVAFRNTTLPTRNLAVFDGLQQASSAAVPVDIAVSGFITPSTGTVKSVIGVVAYDGDRGSLEGTGAGGSLQFGPSTASLAAVFNTPNPINDVFNSTITNSGSEVLTPRNPSFTNTLGIDIDTLTPNTPLPNGSTSAVVRVIGTSGDTIYPGVITLATEIFVPNIKDSLTKSVTDVNGGVVVPGDVLQYELVIRNSGNDGAKEVTLSDQLPTNVTFLPGTLVVTGANAGSKTDASSDDQADYVAGTRTVNFRLGTGANATLGGLILPNEESRARFQVTVNAATPGGTVIDNTGTVNYKSQTLGTAVTDTSDSDPVTPGDQPARVTVAGPDLTLSKTHLGNASEGGTASFVLRVSNAGPAPTFGAVTVSDALPAGLTLVSTTPISAGGTGWSCTPSPLQCSRSDVLAVGSSYPDLTVQVRAAPGSRGTLTNTASVAAASEASAQSGNNGASDVLTVQPPPSVILSKTVRNVSGSGAAGTANTAQPKQILEYCVTFRNNGGDAPDFTLLDDAPPGTTPLPDAYGAGLGVQLTLGSISTLTSTADADAASLVAGRLSYAHGKLLLGQVGTLCFQVSVN